MSHSRPSDLGTPNLLQQPFIDIAQAHSRDDALVQAFALLENACGPVSAQIVWAVDEQRLLGSLGEPLPLQVPGVAALASLERGELDIVWDDGTCTVFGPLSARGELMGWMFLDLPAWTPEMAALLHSLAAQLGPTIALHEAAERYEERIRHLQILTEVGQLLSGVLDLERLFDAIYMAACRVTDVANFYLAFYDPELDELQLSYVVSNGVRLEGHFRWKSTEGLSGIAIRSRAPLYTEDYLTECKRHGVPPRPFGELPLGRAWLGIPLIANNVPIGIMNINSDRLGPVYRAEHVELLTAIGAQAAVALANARLFHRNERQARQLATLNRIGRTITSSLDPEQVPSLIMEQVCDLLNVEEGSLLLVDQDSGELVFAYTNGPVGSQLLGQRIPRGRGLAGHVVGTGESLIVNNAQGDKRFYNQTDKTTGFTTRELLAVPLRGVLGVQGVIEVMNRRDNSPFSEDDRRMLESVADQAVIALENARRFAQVDQALARRAQELSSTNAMLQHNLQSLTALNALSMAITTSLSDAHEIFSMTAHGVVEVSGAQGAMVLLPDGDDFAVDVRVGTTLPPNVLEAVSRAVMHTGRPQLILEGQGSSGTLFAVPLRAPQHMLGVLCVFFDGESPAASDQETVVLFATQAAAAVESLNLFAEVRGARDQMASILASTREGVLLIGPDRTIAVANAALHRLTNIDLHEVENVPLERFLELWEQRVGYAPEEWSTLQLKLQRVAQGSEPFAFAYLNALNAAACSLEWAAMPVSGSHAEQGGVLLVLRDITEAREAERLRHDLTNMIVHDLRSPLSSVMAAIDMLTRGISGGLTDSQRHVLGIAYASSVHMLEMINTLLDISRLEDGRMPIALKPQPILHVIEQAQNQLDSLAQQRAIAVLTDVPDELPDVPIDRELIVRVLQNLLGNALKFSSRGSTVLVRASLERPELRIAVSDRGVGIALKDQDKIFAKFGQVGESRGGSGLGLTFCKLVIEAHGGRMWLESEPGQGSTFFFSVPL